MAHHRAARILADAEAEPQIIASQLLASEPAGEDWAVQALRAAARDAQARGATKSAVTYLKRALDEAPAPDHRAAVLLELGLAEASAGLPAAPRHLRMALAASSQPNDRARIAAELAVTLEHQGHAAEAVIVLKEAIAGLRGGNSGMRMSLQAQAVVVANTFLVARRLLVDEVTRARTELSQRDSPDAAPLLAALALETSRRHGTAEQTAAYANRSLAAGLGTESLWDAVVVIAVAEALARCDLLNRAESVLNRLLAAARARGATHIESAVLTARAVVFNRAGRLLEAEGDARLAVVLSEEQPHDFLRPYKLVQLANALIEQGDVDGAARLVTPIELARQEDDQSFFHVLLRDTHARLLGLQGHFGEALNELPRVEEANVEWDISNPGWTEWRSSAAAIQQRLGKYESRQVCKCA
jgi:hypothetical protein